MKLFIFENARGIADCHGIIAEDIKHAANLMNTAQIDDDTFEEIPSKSYVAYCKERGYDLHPTQWKLLKTFDLEGNFEYGVAFMVEE